MEKEVIKKIPELRAIKPSKDWAVSIKSQILEGGESEAVEVLGKKAGRFAGILDFTSNFEKFISKVFFKPIYPVAKQSLCFRAFATVVVFGLLFGVFGLAQGSLPGDSLYSVKRLSEQVKIKLASENEKPKVQLEITNKKLEELTVIAVADNKGRNLAPAMAEVEKSLKKSAESLKAVVIKDIKDNSQNSENAKEIVKIFEKVAQQTETAGIILTTKVAPQEIEELEKSVEPFYQAEAERYKIAAEVEIKELENRIALSDEDEQEILEKRSRLEGIKNDFAEGEKYYEEQDYSAAYRIFSERVLPKFLYINN